MVVFVLDNAACNADERICVRLKLFIQITNGYTGRAQHIFANARYAQAAFVVAPVFSFVKKQWTFCPIIRTYIN